MLAEGVNPSNELQAFKADADGKMLVGIPGALSSATITRPADTTAYAAKDRGGDYSTGDADMKWDWLLKLILPLFGEILIKYVLPLAKPKVKTALDKILPIAEKWVAVVEKTGLSGSQKYAQAFDHILSQCTADNVIGVTEGLIDTGIQMAWVKLGLNEKPEQSK